MKKRKTQFEIIFPVVIIFEKLLQYMYSQKFYFVTRKKFSNGKY